MAKEDGARYVCDRCGKSAFATPNNAIERAKWHDIKRQSQRGEEARLYCDACYAAYLDLLAKQDSEFTNFEKEVK